MATFTTDLLSSSLCGFVYRGQFGFFKAEKRILFWVSMKLPLHLCSCVAPHVEKVMMETDRAWVSSGCVVYESKLNNVSVGQIIAFIFAGAH